MEMQGLSSIPDVSDADVALLVAALADTGRRVQRVELSRRTVWIKRYGTEGANLWQKLYAPLARFLPVAFRLAPRRSPADMIRQEESRIMCFAGKGFRVPQVLFRSGSALVLSDTSPSVENRLRALKDERPREHEDLLVSCAATLGRLHGAGLCHGRPHPRDMTIVDGEIGFIDFEEQPEAVMPLAVAQARDLWVLFFQLSTRAGEGERTLRRAYAAWSEAAPAAAGSELRALIGSAARFLPLARLIGRVRMGSDLRRFIVATGYLEKAVGLRSEPVGKAGKND
ncbi:serine/threonine protein phosphatase [Rhizobiaceae bacterium BDR2-2]|uniref:Serine/threonine protein phosphatase n=1 Tax=Ectorhizobium quercum TaxID=2965071 RepID=A0AAE3MWD7_9HYPH|nr:serine/threonine protein phosphatase [Ectorhizobium quercum]MCX8996178.1 serine/threonine protein phosphatase [Ectorhizobium quercum]MCX8998783.1 serine/threonine protein phosphatase [Ectorhizobium quercum]